LGDLKVRTFTVGVSEIPTQGAQMPKIYLKPLHKACRGETWIMKMGDRLKVIDEEGRSILDEEPIWGIDKIAPSDTDPNVFLIPFTLNGMMETCPCLLEVEDMRTYWEFFKETIRTDGEVLISNYRKWGYLGLGAGIFGVIVGILTILIRQAQPQQETWAQPVGIAGFALLLGATPSGVSWLRSAWRLQKRFNLEQSKKSERRRIDDEINTRERSRPTRRRNRDDYDD
jgi:hypothetical protein